MSVSPCLTVTQDGLEDQLLALVVNKERPDLEETKTALIIQNNEFTIKLKELEAGAYTGPLFSSTRVGSDTKYALYTS